jgi:hypothetical protein
MVEDPLHGDVGVKRARRGLPVPLAEEARDARVVKAGEQLHLAGEARILKGQGQLEGRTAGGVRLHTLGEVDGAVGAQAAQVHQAPGPHLCPRGQACRIQVGLRHEVPREG